MGRTIGARLLGNLARSIFLGTLVLSLTACGARYRNHGWTPSDQDLADVVVGQDTRESVAETIGTPAATGVLENSGYYYLSARVKRVGPREPEFVDRQLVAVRFDEAGVVSNVERFTLQDGNVVALSRRETDSNIAGVSFLRQLLGNLGRFTADQFLD
ncbi:outer membrane protein assembly factor BamE [Vannielia sp.]|uniref:outer membrane protein assembly factor BamE n=1 Tax=Vannielia sp. TaxID=2813045 RepID=UPI0026185F0F|nr:outer membrane protein assembly factor BamE [Vannielia sp.]MDF1872621.1 outer membrane protein assembly factor BamE [Vannielia sp.]